MSTRTLLLASPTLALLCTAALFAGCSSDRGDGGRKILPVRDAGMNAVRDGGDNTNPGRDGGDITGCGANPNGCAPNELIGNPPGCACLNVCATGYIWNAATMMCDPVGGNRDGGVGGRDGGAQAACTTDTECQMVDPAGVCLNVDGQNPPSRCAGQATCICLVECNPYVADNASGCAAGTEGCFWLGAMAVVPGVCQPLTSGAGTHGQTCTAMFDPGGNVVDDTCERATNHFCVGVSQDDPTGTCARLCDDANPGALCMSLGMYQCDPLDVPDDSVGLCLNVQSYNDLGSACSVGGDCQSNVCSQLLGGSCSASCDGLNQCPANSICLNGTQGGEGLICGRTCTFGNDTECSSLNPQTICERLGMRADGTPVDVCIPRCVQDAECAPGTCNMATGHCQ